MTEDRSFNEFLKAKLEEDVVDIPRIDLSVSSSSNPSSSNPATFQPFNFSTYLIAASLAAVCGMLSVHFASVPEAARDDEVMNAIELLDIDSMTAAADSCADRLLAWQDIPYYEIVD